MTAVGICGTDLHSVKGEWTRPTPTVLGHEGAGIVEAVGEGVTSLRAGDHVVLSWAPVVRRVRGLLAAAGRRGAWRCNRAIAASTLPDGTTGLSLDGETVLPRHGDRRARGADRRVRARGAAGRRGRAARAGGAPRLRRPDRRRRGAVRGAASSRARRCSSSAPAASGSSSSRARASPGPPRSSASIRSRRGASRRRGSARRGLLTRRSSKELMKAELRGRRRLCARRGRRPGDDRDSRSAGRGTAAPA